jgi:hypothetical protein
MWRAANVRFARMADLSPASDEQGAREITDRLEDTGL